MALDEDGGGRRRETLGSVMARHPTLGHRIVSALILRYNVNSSFFKWASFSLFSPFLQTANSKYVQ